jgi:hypothetical protein
VFWNETAALNFCLLLSVLLSEKFIENEQKLEIYNEGEDIQHGLIPPADFSASYKTILFPTYPNPLFYLDLKTTLFIHLFCFNKKNL